MKKKIRAGVFLDYNRTNCPIILLWRLYLFVAKSDKLFITLEKRIEIIAQIIRDSVAIGDLELPHRTNEYELQITIMSTQLGGLVLQELDSPVMEKWLKKINFSHGMFGRIILDGMGWRPLSSEWRYSETVKRFYQEVFPELALDEKGNSIKII